MLCGFVFYLEKSFDGIKACVNKRFLSQNRLNAYYDDDIFMHAIR